MAKWAWRLFLFLLFFAPLAFGTVEQWSITIAESLALLALGLFLWQRRGAEQIWYYPPGLLPLLLFLGYILLQLLPMPMELMRLLSPATHDLYRDTASIVDPAAWVTISVHRQATVAEFWRFAAAVAFYVLTVQLLSDKERLQRCVGLLVGLAGFVALLAILQKFTSPDKIYWFRTVPINATATGPYVYHNHFAGLMELLFPLALALFFFYRPRVVYEKSFRERLSALFNHRHISRHVLFGFAALIIGASVFVSLSRGGMLSLALALLFFGFMLLRHRDVPGRRLFYFLFFPVLLVMAVGWFGWQPIIERFALLNVDGTLYEARLDIWRDSLAMARDYSLFGSGFGTYVDLYPAYRSISLGQLIIDHAHNDYIELFTEGGLVGVVLVAAFLASLFRQAFGALKKRREPYSVYLTLAAATGLLSLLVHSWVDFNLHNMANTLYFFLLAGLLVSGANTRLRGRSRHTYLDAATPAGPLKWGGRLLLAGLFAGCLLFQTSTLVAQQRYVAIANLHLNRNMDVSTLESIRERAAGAAALAPLAARYPYAQANVAALLDEKRQAVTAYKRAILLQPTRGEQLQRLGLYLAGLGEDDAADRLLRSGIERERMNPQRYLDYARYLFSRDDRQAGLDAMRRAISLDAGQINHYIYLMALYGMSEEEIGRAIPEEPQAFLRYGIFLEDTGKVKPAEQAYRKMLTLMDRQGAAAPVWFYLRVYSFYRKQLQDEAALGVMLKAIEHHPNDPKLRYLAGDLYERLGIRYRAVEEYQKGLTLAPEHGEMKQRLRRLSEG